VYLVLVKNRKEPLIKQ